MNLVDIEKLKFPIGHFEPLHDYNQEKLKLDIATIKDLPKALINITKGFSAEHFDTAYRPGGWTIKQLLHHIGDSHMNALIRMKWTLTEDVPTIKTYRQDAWIKCGDVSALEPKDSIILITGLHKRMGALLDSLDEKDLNRKFIHPEYGKEMTLYNLVGLYGWHSKHHFAHIKNAIDFYDWNI